jgi:WD40 repeat protein
MVSKIDNLTGAMFAVAFTPDGSSSRWADSTRPSAYDVGTCALNRTLKGLGETISAIAISPGGRTLATGGFDPANDENSGKIIFWNLPTGMVTRTLRLPHGVDTIAFSPYGKWLAVTNFGGKEVYLFSGSLLHRSNIAR